ncbi:MAG: hypothetical protein HYV68_02030 [Candidatus Taylorbacteria bacterium]|nr:hypothetical protein [Candidatus Taylorbacteria bacterium]
MHNIEKKSLEVPAQDTPEGKMEVFDKRIRRYSADETGPKSELTKLRQELNQEADEPASQELSVDFEDSEELPVEITHNVGGRPEAAVPDNRIKPKRSWWDRFKIAIAVASTATALEQATSLHAEDAKNGNPPVFRQNAVENQGVPKISAVEKYKERAKELALKSGVKPNEGAKLTFKVRGGVPTDLKLDGQPVGVPPEAYSKEEWEALYTGEAKSGGVEGVSSETKPVYKYEQRSWKKKKNPPRLTDPDNIVGNLPDYGGAEVKLKKPDLVEDITGKDPSDFAKATSAAANHGKAARKGPPMPGVYNFNGGRLNEVASGVPATLDPEKKARAEWVASENARLQKMRDRSWRR